MYPGLFFFFLGILIQLGGLVSKFLTVKLCSALHSSVHSALKVESLLV